MKTLNLRLLVSIMIVTSALFPVLVSGQSTNNYSVCQGLTEPYWVQNPGVGSAFAWTITPGVSGTNWSITANNNDDILVNWILPGVYTVQVIETTSDNCIGDPIQLTVTIVPTPTVANAGPDQTLCGTLIATLAGNTPTIGTGTWSMISGPGTVNFLNANDPFTTATASIFGVYVLRWTTSNGICPVSTDELTLTLNLKPVTNGIWHN